MSIYIASKISVGVSFCEMTKRSRQQNLCHQLYLTRRVFSTLWNILKHRNFQARVAGRKKSIIQYCKCVDDAGAGEETPVGEYVSFCLYQATAESSGPYYVGRSGKTGNKRLYQRQRTVSTTDEVENGNKNRNVGWRRVGRYTQRGQKDWWNTFRAWVRSYELIVTKLIDRVTTSKFRLLQIRDR